MKKVKAILHTFWVSAIPNHLFYPKLLHSRTSFSLKYFILCIVSFSLLFTIGIYTKVGPNKVAFYHKAFINALNTFPDSAELTLKDRKLQSAYNRPIFIWMEKSNGTQMLLLAVNQHSTMQQNDSPESLIFLGAERLRLSYKDMTTIDRYPSGDYVINKQTVSLFATVIDQYLSGAQGFFYLIFFTLLPLTYISAAFEASLAISILLYLIFHIFTKRVHIRKCIQVGLHASLLPLLIGSALLYSFPSVHGTLTITTALIFIFQLIALYEAYFSELSKKLASHHHTSGR